MRARWAGFRGEKSKALRPRLCQTWPIVLCDFVCLEFVKNTGMNSMVRRTRRQEVKACAECGRGHSRGRSRANFGACSTRVSAKTPKPSSCAQGISSSVQALLSPDIFHDLQSLLACGQSPKMSPSTKPPRNIKVNVPRHNSQRIGPLMTASVETVAREERIRVDVSQTALEPSSALAQAIVRLDE